MNCLLAIIGRFLSIIITNIVVYVTVFDEEPDKNNNCQLLLKKSP
jgi:hypothetical protein